LHKGVEGGCKGTEEEGKGAEGGKWITLLCGVPIA